MLIAQPQQGPTQPIPAPARLLFRTAILLIIYGIGGLVYIFWIIRASYGAVLLSIDGLVFTLGIFIGAIWTSTMGCFLLFRKLLLTTKTILMVLFILLPSILIAYDTSSYYGPPIITVMTMAIGGLIIYRKKLTKDVKLVMVLILIPLSYLTYEFLKYYDKAEIYRDLFILGLLIYIVILWRYLRATAWILKHQNG